MSDLASWLLSQIAADEAAARAAYDEASDYRVVGSELAELHFVNWKPDRVLADCAAKRAIVELHERLEDVCEICMQYDRDDNVTSGWWPCLTLRLLAQPYADRPGFDPTWKVET